MVRRPLRLKYAVALYHVTSPGNWREVIYRGLLKKAASGVLAIFACSRTAGTFRAQKWLWPCWMNFFEPTRSPLTFKIFLGVFVIEELNYSTFPISVPLCSGVLLKPGRKPGGLPRAEWELEARGRMFYRSPVLGAGKFTLVMGAKVWDGFPGTCLVHVSTLPAPD